MSGLLDEMVVNNKQVYFRNVPLISKPNKCLLWDFDEQILDDTIKYQITHQTSAGWFKFLYLYLECKRTQAETPSTPGMEI